MTSRHDCRAGLLDGGELSFGYHKHVLDEDGSAALRALIDRYRPQALWFMRERYYPETDVERERVLQLIEQHGDVEALQEVARIRSWLSHQSNAASANS